ncbi:MAG TPA: hypothetical protein VLZ89_01495 [Anaerolineales bacterium]|nr:hypothetical protein [Anaerolineales bacterium]
MVFLTDLTMTLAGYAILAVSYLGLGWASSRFLRIEFPVREKPFSLIWLGWAAALFLLQLLNLVVPINMFSSAPLLILGIIFAVIFFRKELSSRPSLPRAYPALLAIAVLWLAILSMSSPTIYDDGLYHFNSIRWLNEYPIVLGLGNLHGRLAFNQSFFAYAAYLNLYPFFNHGYNLANSFLFLVLLAECLWYLLRFVFQRAQEADFSSSTLAPIFFLPALIYMASVFEVLRTGISSPSPDIASLFLQILLFIHFVRALEEDLSERSSRARIAFILIVSATMITVKLSNLFYVLAVCAMLLLLRITRRQPSARPAPGIIGGWLALPILILALWSSRGVLLSGCPVYPSTFGCLPVPWAEPLASVRSEANWIYSWARENGLPPDQVLTSWMWLGPWFNGILQANGITVVYPVVISSLGIVASVLLRSRSQPKKVDGKTFLLPLPIWVGLIFWFGLAPDPRFANALFWILPVATVLVFLKSFAGSQKVKNRIILALFVLINANVVWFFINNPQTFTMIQAHGYEPVPKVRLVERTTRSGLVVWTPLNGDQCWDSRIPCTPYFNQDLNFLDNQVFPEFTTRR